MSGSLNNSGPPHDSPPEPSPEGKAGNRLPPPAFPPGTRRARARPKPEEQPTAEAADAGSGFITAEGPLGGTDSSWWEAFISPDDPIPGRTEGGMDDAFISPDDPMPERTPSGQAGARSAAAYDAMAVTSDDAEGVVTGMGDDAHLDPTELALGGDPHVRAVAEAVSKLAASLEQKGEAGLRTSLEMTRFEAQLRAYCVGYLAGKRAEDEAS